jgi:hypothetical protein
VEAGKAMGMPEKKLKVEVLQYEEQVMQGVAKRPWLREDAKWRIDTDKEDLKKVQEKLKEAKAAWAKQIEEMKKKAKEKEKAPASPQKGVAPKAPDLEETLPPPVEIGPKDLPSRPKLSVMDAAKEEVIDIMSRKTSFKSDFDQAPAVAIKTNVVKNR